MKKALLTVSALAAVVAASGAGLHGWLKGRLSKEAIVAQMESSWNCRAEIGSVTPVFMSSPARLEIVGCQVAPRDAEVTKPLGQRTPLAEGAADVVIARVVLEVKLQDLISRRLNIQQLVLSDISVREDVPRGGDSSLAVLFSKPPRHAEAAATVVTEPAPPTPPTPLPAEVLVQPSADKPAPPVIPDVASVPSSTPALKPAVGVGAKAEAKHEPQVFEARQLGFSVQVRNASLERVAFKRVDHNNTTKTDITDLSFSITDIDVNPADLAAHNSLKLALNCRLKQRGRIGPKDARREVTMAELLLDGEGILNPFDVETGAWQPVSTLRLNVRKGTVLGGFATLGEAIGKDLKKAEGYGIDLADVPMGGTLLEDARIHVSFQNDRITFLENAVFAMTESELALQKGSWLNAAEDANEMQARITLGADLQSRIGAGVKKNLGEEQGASILKMLADERGRVYFDLRSSGRLSKFKADMDWQRLLNRVIQGLDAGGLIDSLLKRK